MFYCSSSGSDPLSVSKRDILRGIITEKLSTAAREILAVVERTVADYEEEAAGFRQEIDRQRRQLEVLQPQVKLHRRAPLLQSHEEEVVVGEDPVERQLTHNSGVDDPGGLDFLWYDDNDPDDDVESVVQFTQRPRRKRQKPKDPDYEMTPRVQPEKRRPSKPLISDGQTHLDFKVRLLEDPQVEVLSNNVFQKSPMRDISCPRGLQEADFLNLLRSTFPQLAAGEPFDLFMTDRQRRLLPLMVSSLNAEEIYVTIKSCGHSALYIRLKTAVYPQSSSDGVLPQPVEEGPSVSSATPSSDQDEQSMRLSSPGDQTQKRRRGRPRHGEEPTHHFLRICVLENPQLEAPAETELHTSSVRELKCPRGLQEADFLELLRVTFPQLVGDDKKICIYKSDRSRKLQKLRVNTITPEDIYRTMKSTGVKKHLLYIKLKTGEEDDSENEENLQLVKDEPQLTTCGVMEDESAPLQSPEYQSGGSTHEDDEAGERNARADEEWKPSPEEAEDLEDLEDPKPREAIKQGPRRLGEKGDGSKASCRVCGVFYRTLSNFARHAWSHVDDPQSVCGVCGEKFDSSEDLKGHLRTHQQTYDCSYCGKAFVTTTGLKNHVTLHTGERQYKCDICNKSFSYKSAMRSHRWVHVEDRPHKCDICPKSFGLKGHLVAHKKCHVGRDQYLCNICGRSVFDLRSLTRHKLTHSTERRHGCKVCGKRFKLEGTLKAHEKVHTVRDRMYLCHVCCKAFLSNSTLMAHMKTHSDERPFVCPVCSRSFLTKWDLRKHMRIHTGEAPYGCTRCGRHFKLKSTLNVHIRSHLGIKRFTCGVCGKACSRQEHLTVHMRTHNGERPYKCSLCDKAFTQSHCLKTHMKSHHPEETLVPEPSTSFLQPPDTV
ncbi:zinc finger and SCAN domain-containing protein 2-like isoform X2 [Cyprinodon tularosa]|uniref:zinc finger and SCAN domain-containing protein 2-like isoform X2 n=1 Tax=Cyprinodon tularosa TaxID=77115 RepID=UPI0018E23105|nr:zinc finger and SCAN domain-containing protein 2-like isoform X2 [Cyprinodon tularosa]